MLFIEYDVTPQGEIELVALINAVEENGDDVDGTDWLAWRAAEFDDNGLGCVGVPATQLVLDGADRRPRRAPYHRRAHHPGRPRHQRAGAAVSTTRSQLYRFARDLGNVEAVEHGYRRGGLSGAAGGAAQRQARAGDLPGGQSPDQPFRPRSRSRAATPLGLYGTAPTGRRRQRAAVYYAARRGTRQRSAHTRRGAGVRMEDTKAKKLLSAERHRVEGLLKDIEVAGVDDRTAADQEGEMYDSAEPLTTEGTDDAVRAELEERLAAVGRAERRVEVGTYGLSVRSGLPIPDDRLTADPTAELTVEEAAEAEEGPGLSSLS